MLNVVKHMNLVIAVLFTLGYFYQIVYTIVGLMKKNKQPIIIPSKQHKFAALICARNEKEVISEIIGSLKRQKYPHKLLDIYVLADNCTDNTAALAREAGAIVYERENDQQVGKGYALDYLLKKIRLEHFDESYDGYFVFDADNIVEENFVCEMNKIFDKGYDVITCYRNSKNFADNWITAGYSIWFLREARFLNFPRMLLGTNCAISGTGFCVSDQLIRENGGWPFNTMTEDIEFTVNCAVNNRRIGYCDKAMVYDEQPTTFLQSYYQRLRWSKGFYQVNIKYSASLAKKMVTCGGRRGHTCYDMFMTIAPCMLLSLFIIIFNAVVGVAFWNATPYVSFLIKREVLHFILFSFLNLYIGVFICGILTVVTEWDMIKVTNFRKVRYLLSFPLFMSTYIPIAVIALFQKVEWRHIQHTSVSSVKNVAAALTRKNI